MAALVGEFEGLLFSELASQADLPIPQAQLFRLLVVADAFGFFLFFFSFTSSKQLLSSPYLILSLSPFFLPF